MADTKISALPAATTPLAGAELVAIVQGGETRKVAVADLDTPPLGLWDYWEENWFGSTNAAASVQYVGAAVSGGTNNTAIPVGSLDGYSRGGVVLRSGTTANGGYRYQTSSFVADYFGVISHKFRCRFKSITSFTGRTVRCGYLDALSSTVINDGAYFELADGVVSAVTANNNNRTTHPTTFATTLNVSYVYDIEVNAAGTEARFRLYEGTNETPVLDVTITTNIPTNNTARLFGNGIIATEVSTTASDIGILYALGEGTVAGFNRARG